MRGSVLERSRGEERLREERLREIAARCGGEDLCTRSVGGCPVFVWLFGSSLIELRLGPDGSAAFNAVVLLGPVRSRGLEQILASTSRRMRVGVLLLDDEGDVVIRHRFDAGETAAAIEADLRELCELADVLDDPLQREFGGQLAYERFREEVLQALGRGASVAPCSAADA
jgi:hypothetical protein